MIGVTGGVNSFDEPACQRCKGSGIERRTKAPCKRCEGSGNEPDTRRSTPCPICTHPVVFRINPEYHDKRWEYAICGECATDWYIVHRMGEVVSITQADL